jgi:phosphatidylglycerophosphatase C
VKLVVVDFDNTLLKKDSFFYFILFDRGFFRLASILILFLPLLVIVKFFPSLGGYAKSCILKFVYRNRTVDDFLKSGDLFFNYLKDNNYFNSELLSYLHSLQEKGYEICIVSASPDFIIKPVAVAYNYTFIATQFRFVEGRFTGKYSGKNCKGVEKVVRIKQKYDLNALTHLIAIGNKDDKEMLDLADESILI